MILSYDNEGHEEKDASNESIEISKINKIEVLLTKQIEGEHKKDNGSSLNLSLPLSNNENDSGNNSQPLSNKDAPLSREEQCFQTDVWQEIEKCVKQREEKPNVEDQIINVSSESSTSSHHSKNYILKSELTGRNNQMETIDPSFLSNTNNNNNVLQSHQTNAYDKKALSNLNPFTVLSEDESPIFSPKNQMAQNFSPSTNIQTKPSSTNTNHFGNGKKKKNYDTLSYDEIINSCSDLCKEQIGCRFLQKCIDDYPKIAKEMYLKIKDKIEDLSCDSFGNYFIQKIIEKLSLSELDDLIRGDLATYFKHICLSPHGTRVIQKYLEKIFMHDYLLNIFNILIKPNVLEFCKNPNANHIIIKYISLIESPRNDFIIHSLNTNLVEIATNKHSCCALQKCLDCANPHQKQFLLMTIAKNANVLFTNQFGNYVTQFALGFGDRDANKIIINSYLQEFPKYSSHKFASNVFEKCLEFSEKETKKLIIERLCNPSIIQNLLFDTYGNYVLQKTMQQSTEPYRSKYITIIQPLLEKLQMYPFGHKIYQKLITNFPELMQYKNYQHNIGFPMNNYGNICYQNNHIYNPIYFQGANMNMNKYEKPQGFVPHPSFHYMGQNMYN